MYRLLVLILLFCTTGIFAQKKISGVITSEQDKEPLIGASILVKGTTTGTITNLDGAFELTVPDNAVLVVSFIGMVTQEIPVGSQTEFNIVLKSEAVALKEVVVVAYGTQRRDRFNGSVSTVKSDEITAVPSASVDKMLQGNVPGLLSTSSSGQPGAASEIRIRGIGSINASSEPLYVVDGVPMPQGNLGSPASSGSTNILSTINPNDIESISVLKDAASASQYGSRAANGVILITTKHGSKGETIYDFKTTQGMTSKASDKYRALNSSEYIQLRRAAMQNAGYPASAIDMFAGSDTINTNWSKEIYRPAYFSTYDLSARGGDEKTQFFVSGSYLNQKGIIIGTDLQKGTARVNLTHSANDKLKFGFNTTLSYSLQNSAPGKGQFSNPVLAADLLPPNIAVRNPDGSYNYNFQVLGGNNPVALSQNNINEMNTAQNLSNVFAEYKIIPDLKFKTSWGISYIDLKEKYFQNPFYGQGTATNGLGQKVYSQNLSWLTSNTINYSKKADGHGFEWLAGFEAQSFRKDYGSMIALKFPSDRLTELDAAAEPFGVSSYISRSTIASLFSRLEYNYNERYYLSGSIRRDGCSRFGDDHKWANFYSIGASWRVNEEAFLKDISQISSMKLRTSYGTSGNSEIGDFLSRGTYGFTSYNGSSAMYPKRLPNPDLTWEKNKVFNLGLDTRIFNRFTITLEYFYRVTSDLLLDVPLSSTTGFQTILKNVGSMVNKGFEFSVTSENIKGQEFAWITSFNGTFLKNKVLKLNNDQDIIDPTYNLMIRRVGEDFNSYYTRKWAGVNPADGSAMWYDKNGNIVYDYTKADKEILGSATPKFYGGINNTFTYKSVDLSFLFVLNYGNKIFDFWSGYTESDGKYLYFNQSADQLNYWQKPGDVVSVPKPIYGNPSSSNVGSSRYMHDGSYIRLRNISLGYSLPKSIVEKIHMRNIKIYVSGQNLWTLSRYQGHDVERGSNGINDMSYPNVRTLTFGLDTSF